MTTQKEIVAVFERSQYDSLVTKIPGATCLVTSTTSELQAGYQLGVQAVLQVLREGFVSGR